MKTAFSRTMKKPWQLVFEGVLVSIAATVLLVILFAGNIIAMMLGQGMGDFALIMELAFAGYGIMALLWANRLIPAELKDSGPWKPACSLALGRFPAAGGATSHVFRLVRTVPHGRRRLSA